jgi:uncharacterized protein YjiS (DUF1127 family)
MRQNCIDTFDTTPAPLPSWGQWISTGARLIAKDMLALVAIIALWHKRHHQRRSLRFLDDRTLRDIGLTREQIDEQIRTPFWR